MSRALEPRGSDARTAVVLSGLCLLAALATAVLPAPIGADVFGWAGGTGPAGPVDGAGGTRWLPLAVLAGLLGLGLLLALAGGRARAPHAAGAAPFALPMRSAGMALGIVTAAGLLVRLPVLALGVWRDEASTFFDATLPGSMPALIDFIHLAELNPPGYFLVMQQWIAAAGAEGAVFKIPSLAFGLLLIPACYLLARAAGGGILAGLVAAFVICISGEAIYYSQEARPYAMAALVTALTAVALMRALAAPRPANVLLLALSGAALLYTHYTGLMAIGALGGAGLLVAWRRGDARALAGLVVAGLGAAVLFAPWVPTFLFHLSTGTPWTEATSLLERPVLLLKNVSYTLPWWSTKLPWPGGEVLLAPFALLIVLAVLAGLAAFARGWNAAPRGGALTPLEGAVVLSLAVAGPAIALAAMGYPQRYMFLFLPLSSALFGIWAGMAAAHPLAGPLRRYPLSAALAVGYVCAAAFAWSYAHDDDAPKSGIRTLAARTDDATLRDTAFLLAPDFLAPTFGYYFRDREPTFLAFARMEDPQIFSPVGYAEIWSAPDALDRMTARIEDVAARGFARLSFLQATCDGPLEDRGRMAYSRVNDLRAWLDGRYDALDETIHAGRSECVRETVYDLDASARADAS